MHRETMLLRLGRQKRWPELFELLKKQAAEIRQERGALAGRLRELKAMAETAGNDSAAYGAFLELAAVDEQLRGRLEKTNNAMDAARRRVHGA